MTTKQKNCNHTLLELFLNDSNEYTIRCFKCNIFSKSSNNEEEAISFWLLKNFKHQTVSNFVRDIDLDIYKEDLYTCQHEQACICTVGQIGYIKHCPRCKMSTPILSSKKSVDEMWDKGIRINLLPFYIPYVLSLVVAAHSFVSLVKELFDSWSKAYNLVRVKHSILAFEIDSIFRRVNNVVDDVKNNRGGLLPDYKEEIKEVKYPVIDINCIDSGVINVNRVEGKEVKQQ